MENNTLLPIRLGIDVGSTTVKTVLLNENCEIIHKSYDRHFAKPKFAVAQTLSFLKDKFANSKFYVSITGSAGLGISKSCNIDFVQEVFATSLGVKKAFPKTLGSALFLGISGISAFAKSHHLQTLFADKKGEKW